MLNKCVFLDRDGVLNFDHGDYTWKLDDFKVLDGVGEALHTLKTAGYQLIVITNQAGIAKGMYTDADVAACHQKLQEETGFLIDAFYHSPYHPSVTESIGRKPGTLLFEKGMAKFNIDPKQSWMIGDRARDIEAGQSLGMKTVFISGTEEQCALATHQADSLLEAVKLYILS